MTTSRNEGSGGFRNFEEERFDFPENIQAETSGFASSMQLVQSVALSRPFLLAVIAFLVYRLWVSSRAGNGVAKSSISVIDSGRHSLSQDRLSVRKSQRPMLIPSMTSSGKR